MSLTLNMWIQFGSIVTEEAVLIRTYLTIGDNIANCCQLSSTRLTLEKEFRAPQ